MRAMSFLTATLMGLLMPRRLDSGSIAFLVLLSMACLSAMAERAIFAGPDGIREIVPASR